MPDSSPNTPAPGVTLTTDPLGRNSSGTQQVFREKLEIMLARQQLRAVKNPEEKFNIYEVLITLEIGHSENIPEPAQLDPQHKQWVIDKALLMDISKQYDERKPPVARWPATDVLPGMRNVTKVTRDGENAPVFVPSEQLPGYLQVLMQYLTHRAYQLACHPMSKWHRQLVSLMDRWDIITIDTEVLSNLASFTTADQKTALARANAHVAALEQQGHGVMEDSEPGDGDIDSAEPYAEIEEMGEGPPTG